VRRAGMWIVWQYSVSLNLLDDGLSGLCRTVGQYRGGHLRLW
jgi:hypothetical protein